MIRRLFAALLAANGNKWESVYCAECGWWHAPPKC
ncbi:hypothetical protein SRB5_39150 [Streptomyces sp. RB5]|uniref:Uncharacterized protein n=1 Tax=Streptomyces smaragdinus TaxID=2585196 RepID=A0A7K0CKJ7_9ACTN|nr:hypothetical protein [Streptomyces smaragdinus]